MNGSKMYLAQREAWLKNDCGCSDRFAVKRCFREAGAQKKETSKEKKVWAVNIKN